MNPSLNLPNNRFYWFLLFIGLLVIGIMSSCNVAKKLQKKSTTTKSDSTAVIISTTTATETAVGELKIEADTLSTERDEGALSEHPIEIEDEDLKLIVTRDKVTRRIKATAIQKAKIVPISTTKVTNNKTVSEVSVKKSSDVKEKAIDKKITGGLNMNWLWLLLLIALLFLAWRLGLFTKDR